MDDDNVANFVAITSVEPDKAAQYLRLTDGNLERAVQLFFEGGPLDVGGTQSIPGQSDTANAVSSHARATSGGSGFQDEEGVVHLDSDEDDFGDDMVRALDPASAGGAHAGGQSMEDDEAMARRLQEEMYNPGDRQRLDGEEVRAPLARTTETLVGPDADWPPDADGMRAAVMEQLQRRQRPRPRQERLGIFNQRGASAVWQDTGDDPDTLRENLSRATGGASERSAKSNMLAEMYRPPFELISNLSWDVARDEGKHLEKWLLINVQDEAIFDCQVLNRDIWKNEDIKQTVKDNFIFLQYGKNDQRAMEYNQYYFRDHQLQDAYPHIAIVDPRTGEQVKTWSGVPPPKPLEFLHQLHEFLERYSLKVNSRNPVAKRKPEPRKEKNIDRMTEEEMLEMALQASLNNNNGDNNQASGLTDATGTREADPDALTRDSPIKSKGKGKEREIIDLDAMDVEDEDSIDINDASAHQSLTPSNGQTTIQTQPPPYSSTSTSTEAAPPQSDEPTALFASIASNQTHIEPTDPSPALTTRIQFRYSGGRLIRRFSLSDPVRRIFEWLKADFPVPDQAGKRFELMFMGRNLLRSLDESVEEAGLKNGTVMVEVVEE